MHLEGAGGVVLRLHVVVLAHVLGVALVVLVQTQLVEHAAGHQQAGAVGGGIVGEAHLQAVAGQLRAAQGDRNREGREGRREGRLRLVWWGGVGCNGQVAGWVRVEAGQLRAAEKGETSACNACLEVGVVQQQQLRLLMLHRPSDAASGAARGCRDSTLQPLPRLDVPHK